MKQLHLNEEGEMLVYFDEAGEGYTQAQLDYYEAKADLAANLD